MSAMDISGLAFFIDGPFCLLALGFSDFSEKMTIDGAYLALVYGVTINGRNIYSFDFI